MRSEEEIREYKNKLAELKAENERLKEEVRTEKIYSSQIEELEESLNHLKQENERLKILIKDLQIRKDRYYLKGLEQERQISDYITLLQEIKEKLIQVNKFCTTHKGIYDDNCIKVLVSTIIDIITKAEEGWTIDLSLDCGINH